MKTNYNISNRRVTVLLRDPNYAGQIVQLEQNKRDEETDLKEYALKLLRQHGCVPASEIGKVFGYTRVYIRHVLSGRFPMTVKMAKKITATVDNKRGAL